MKPIELISFAQQGKDGKTRLDWTTMLRFLDSKDYATIPGPESGGAHFSLHGFDYVNADGLLWLLLLGEHLRKREVSLWLDLPDRQGPLKDVKRFEFHTVAREVFSLTNSYLLDGIQSDTLHRALQFRRIDISSLTNLLNDFNNFLAVQFISILRGPKYNEIAFDKEKLGLATKEISKNIVQHSQSKPDTGWGYYITSQLGRGAGGLLRICLGDAGVGLKSSLSSKGIVVKDDYEAIRRALLFRYYDREGEGLFRVVKYVSHFSGVIRIHSGRSSAFLSTAGGDFNSDETTKIFIEKNLKRIQQSVLFPGVQLQIDMTIQP